MRFVAIFNHKIEIDKKSPFQRKQQVAHATILFCIVKQLQK